MVLGVRPEDLSVAPTGTGNLTGSLFSLEPTGDQTLVCVKTEALLVVARAARDFRQPIGTSLSLAVTPERIHLFDGASGVRI